MAFIVLVCLFLFGNTSALGAFPALLPDIGRTGALSDAQLGSLAAAFGFARLVADVPIGLFLAHHLRRAFVLSPLLLLSGLVCLVSGAPYPVLVLGRGLMGLGHGLGMMAGLTAILRFRAGARLSSYLNAVEFSGMIGILSGATIISLLPTRLPWQAAFATACSPLLLGVVIVPWILRRVPRAARRAPLFARHAPALAGDSAASRRPARTPLVRLAFVAGAAVALAYSTVEQFLIPLRGTRELSLDRSGVARLLMLMQASDIVALMPVGRLSDRLGPARVLSVIVVLLGTGTALIGFGRLPVVAVGCVLAGVGIAGWMLPLSVLRQETSAQHITWRTAVYRLGVDGGIFLGPFASGLLGERHAAIVWLAVAVVLVTVGFAFGRARGARAAAA
ncbi:MAG: MFS transporter [Candidatus Rokubacteria bacterium]|nr:MFS transporter [Candidatus Rokubacteria bacterium]